MIPSIVEDSIDETYADALVHLGSLQDEEWEVLYTDDFYASPIEIFDSTLSEAFVRKLHAERGTTELVISEWAQEDDTNLPNGQPVVLARTLQFITHFKDFQAALPTQTTVYQTQRIRFYGRNKLVMDYTTSTPHLKLGDTFSVLNRYIFTSSDGGKCHHECHMEASIAFKWLKHTIFKRLIMAKGSKEAEEGFRFWSTKVRALFPRHFDLRTPSRGRSISGKSGKYLTPRTSNVQYAESNGSNGDEAESLSDAVFDHFVAVKDSLVDGIIDAEEQDDGSKLS